MAITLTLIFLLPIFIAIIVRGVTEYYVIESGLKKSDLEKMSKMLARNLQGKSQVLNILIEGSIVLGSYLVYMVYGNIPFMYLLLVIVCNRVAYFIKSRSFLSKGQICLMYLLSKREEGKTFFTTWEVRKGSIAYWLIFGFYPTICLFGHVKTFDEIVQSTILSLFFVFWTFSISVMSPKATQLHTYEMGK